jgi:hypothetical protein
MQEPVWYTLAQEIFRCVHDVERLTLEARLVEVNRLRLLKMSAWT